jgi:hypothetical protein
VIRPVIRHVIKIRAVIPAKKPAIRPKKHVKKPAVIRPKRLVYAK